MHNANNARGGLHFYREWQLRESMPETVLLFCRELSPPGASVVVHPHFELFRINRINRKLFMVATARDKPGLG